MKKYTLLFYLFFPSVILTAQGKEDSICKSILVWDFSYADNTQQDGISENLTQSVSENLTKLKPQCIVINRSEFGQLSAIYNQEKSISGLYNKSNTIKDTFIIKGVQRVLFGKITKTPYKQKRQDGLFYNAIKYKLVLTIDNINTHHEGEVSKVFDFEPDDSNDDITKRYIDTLVKQLLNIVEPPSEEVKKTLKGSSPIVIEKKIDTNKVNSIPIVKKESHLLKIKKNLMYSLWSPIIITIGSGVASVKGFQIADTIHENWKKHLIDDPSDYAGTYKSEQKKYRCWKAVAWTGVGVGVIAVGDVLCYLVSGKHILETIRKSQSSNNRQINNLNKPKLELINNYNSVGIALKF